MQTPPWRRTLGMHRRPSTPVCRLRCALSLHSSMARSTALGISLGGLSGFVSQQVAAHDALAWRRKPVLLPAPHVPSSRLHVTSYALITTIGGLAQEFGKRRPWACAAWHARGRVHAMAVHTWALCLLSVHLRATRSSATHPRSLVMPTSAARDRNAHQPPLRRPAPHGPFLAQPHASLQHHDSPCCGVLHCA